MEQRLRLVQGTVGRVDQRAAERRSVHVPAQLVWKDGRGQTRLATVVTRDVSDYGVLIESRGDLNLPLYRLVYLQVDRQARNRPDLPDTLRRQSVMSAVFRVSTASDPAAPNLYALRMLVERRRAPATRTA
jgi:hypothetical protein